MKSNGGVLSADEVVHQPITTVLSGPAAGALGAALIAKVAGFDRVLTSDGGGTSTDVSRRDRRRADADDRGLGRRVPVEDPDDRRRHRRRRRWLDRLAVARGHAQGRAAVGGRRPRPALLRQGRHRRHHHRRPRATSAGSRRTCSAARSRSTCRPPSDGVEQLASQAGPEPGGLRHRHPRDLRVEPGQRAAPGHRQARPRRPRLHADHVRRLGVAAAVPADGRARHPDRAGAARTPATCRRSGCSPSTSRTTTCRPTSRSPTPSTRRPCRGSLRRPDRQARGGADQGGLRRGAAPVRAHRRPALLRAGVRGAGAGARGDRRRAPCSTRWPAGSTPSTGRSTATTSPATTPSRSSG